MTRKSADATSGASPRSPRSDAVRNRQALIDAARAALSRDDADRTVEGIARSAGVGVGTLYRHFGTREALFGAVYSAELTAVELSADSLLAEAPPELALRAWINRYAAFVATKFGMVDVLQARSLSDAFPAGVDARERITATLEKILAAGVREGVFRPDIAAADVTRMLVGMVLTTAADDSETIARLTNLLIRGIRRDTEKLPSPRRHSAPTERGDESP